MGRTSKPPKIPTKTARRPVKRTKLGSRARRVSPSVEEMKKPIEQYDHRDKNRLNKPPVGYNGRSLLPRQVFFPMAGEMEGWAKLATNLKGEVDGHLFEAYRGTVPLPLGWANTSACQSKSLMTVASRA